MGTHCVVLTTLQEEEAFSLHATLAQALRGAGHSELWDPPGIRPGASPMSRPSQGQQLGATLRTLLCPLSGDGFVYLSPEPELAWQPDLVSGR